MSNRNSTLNARLAVHLMVVAAVLIFYSVFLGSRGWHGGFRFEKYEGFLGIGQSNEVGATAALSEKFPIGTPLERYEQFFNEIGGRCFTLRDYPNRLICTYAHMRFPPMPFILTTWAVVVDYDLGTRTSTRLKVAPGVEGL